MSNHINPKIEQKIRLCLLAGKTIREIAKKLGVDKDTVLARRAALVAEGKLAPRSS